MTDQTAALPDWKGKEQVAPMGEISVLWAQVVVGGMQGVKGHKEWQWEREFSVDVAVVLIGFAYAYIHRKQMC